MGESDAELGAIIRVGKGPGELIDASHADPLRRRRAVQGGKPCGEADRDTPLSKERRLPHGLG